MQDKIFVTTCCRRRSRARPLPAAGPRSLCSLLLLFRAFLSSFSEGFSSFCVGPCLSLRSFVFATRYTYLLACLTLPRRCTKPFISLPPCPPFGPRTPHGSMLTTGSRGLLSRETRRAPIEEDGRAARAMGSPRVCLPSLLALASCRLNGAEQRCTRSRNSSR